MTKPIRLALITYEGLPSLSNDDRLLKAELERNGFDVEVLDWQNSTEKLKYCRAIILRSVWDYHKKFREFEAWLGTVAKLGVQIFNPVSILRWNANKIYLRELETAGFPILPTYWMNRDFAGSLKGLMEAQGWPDVVVKPNISASATRTQRVSRVEVEAFETVFRKWASEQDFMIQPFQKEIQTEGEWSLLYFGGHFSHAVLKLPAKGDFRVQEEFGGKTRSAELATEFRKLGDQVSLWLTKKFGQPALFLRADFFSVAGQPVIGELELIEPFLFFSSRARSAGEFVQALKNLLR